MPNYCPNTLSLLIAYDNLIDSLLFLLLSLCFYDWIYDNFIDVIDIVQFQENSIDVKQTKGLFNISCNQ